MRQHGDYDCGTNNPLVRGNQEQHAGLDELRYLIVEFQRAFPYFSSVEWQLLDRARARLSQLEAEAR